MSYTNFGTWRGGNEGDKILTCYTFDLFTLSVNIQYLHLPSIFPIKRVGGPSVLNESMNCIAMQISTAPSISLC